MPRKPDDIEQRLLNKFGFTPALNRDPDHRWYELRLEGLPPIRTFLSHGKKEYHRGLEQAVAQQLHVRAPYFDGMMDCTRSSDDYRSQVRSAPFPPFRHSSESLSPVAMVTPSHLTLDQLSLPPHLTAAAFGQGERSARFALLQLIKRELTSYYTSIAQPALDDSTVEQQAQVLLAQAQDRYYQT